MSERIKIDSIAKTLEDALSGYNAEVATATKKAIDETAKEAVKEAISYAPKRTGKYAKHLASKVAYENAINKRVLIYAKSPHYRLSHLLERPHKNPSGRLTRAYPHFEKAGQLAERRLPELIEKKLKEG